MHFIRETRGAISIFLCIVLLALVALSGALVDGGRMRVAEEETKTAIDSAAMSQLTYYDNVLKELYGLFAIANSDPAEIKEAISKDLDERLLSTALTDEKDDKNSKPLNFFDYKVEDIKVNPLYNLSEGDVFKQQILEFMKYRAPKEVADQFIDKFLAFKDLGEQTKILERKLDIDEKLSEAGESTETLSNKVLEINFLVKNNSISVKLDALAASISNRIRAQKLLTDKKNQLSNMTPPVKASDDPEAVKEYEEKLKAYVKSVDALKDEIDEIENKTIPELNKSSVKIKEDLLSHIENDLIQNKVYDEAKKAIKDIKDKSKEAASMANELSTAIKEDSSSFGESMRTDLKSKKQAIDTSVLDEREQEIEKCRNKYREIKKTVADINPESIAFDTISSLPSDLENRVKSLLSYEKIKKLLEDVPKVNYYIKKSDDAGSKENDPRAALKAVKDDIEKEGNALLEEVKKGDEKSKNSFPKSGLPSQDGVKDSLKDIKDLINIDTKLISDQIKIASEKSEFNPDYEGKSDFDMDFKAKKANKSKEALSIIKSLTSIISSGLRSMRDELYVGEYSLGIFKNAVTGKLDSKGNIQYDLTGYKMSTRNDTFFDTAELEYILHGSSSQTENLLWVKGQILLVRWALNTVSIYTDPKKVATALEFATAVAGWTIFGVPLVQTLILLAWSFAESTIDVYKILQGEEIAIFKLNGDWVLSIESGGKGVAKALTGTLTDDVKKKVIDKVKAGVKEKAFEAIDYTSDKVAESIEKGITDQVKDVTGNITDSITKSINQKVDEVLDSAFKPFENAIFTEIGKVEGKFDELRDSIEALNNDVSEKYEDAADGLMEHINKYIYDTVKNNFPEIEKELQKNGYKDLVDKLRDEEKKYFEELKSTGIDFLGRKEKELKANLDKIEEETIGKIKKSIETAKENLRTKLLEGIDNLLLDKFKSTGANITEKINGLVSKKIDSIKNSGKAKIKEKLGSFIDNLGGKSKGSTLKKSVSTGDYTAKVNVKGNILKMGYTGYLRLFLLLVNPDKKIMRIQDLVQLNMEKETGKEFKLSDCNTYLRVEVAFSVKYLFMTSAFMPRMYKDRYKISHIVYKGY